MWDDAEESSVLSSAWSINTIYSSIPSRIFEGIKLSPEMAIEVSPEILIYCKYSSHWAKKPCEKLALNTRQNIFL